MTTTYDLPDVADQIANGDHDDDLWTIFDAVWKRMPTVERHEFRERILTAYARPTSIDSDALATLPVGEDGGPRLHGEATHILLTIGKTGSYILSPERAFWLADALTGQLPAVGYKIAAVPSGHPGKP